MNDRWQGSPRTRALMWMAPCLAAWSLAPRLATSHGNLDAFGFLFWSSAASAAALLLATVAAGRWRVLRAYSTTDVRRIAALAALGAFAYPALLYTAFADCSGAACPERAATVVVAQSAWPAFALLWSAVLLRKRLSTRMFLPLGLVALAIAIAAGGLPPGEGAPWPIARVVVAAIVFGLYSTLLERIGYEPISSMAVGFSVATGLAFLTAGQFSPEPPVLDGAALWPVLVNGVLVNGVSYVCWHRALRAAPIQFVAPWVALTPLIAVAVGSDSTAFQLEHGLAMCLMTAAAFAAAESATNTVPDMRVEPVPRPGDLAEQSR